MGTFSIWHILLFGFVAVLLFGGRGKISEVMGDFAKGIKSFRQGLSDHDEEAHRLTTERRDDVAAKKDS
ncbi:MAG TPA: twin-arginine translocase TatA/TatE family subunit [Rhizomicrobium sp.]|nr:twin-arginine translocase TatA/TatE family subunit [Rhizomicrobium sp.]